VAIGGREAVATGGREAVAADVEAEVGTDVGAEVGTDVGTELGPGSPTAAPMTMTAVEAITSILVVGIPRTACWAVNVCWPKDAEAGMSMRTLNAPTPFAW
jgi:hypothetical protein